MRDLTIIYYKLRTVLYPYKINEANMNYLRECIKYILRGLMGPISFLFNFGNVFI